MKFTLFFLTFALSVTFFAYADENCFDKVRLDAEWGPVKEECKATVTETEHVERVMSIVRCMFQKKEIMSKDLILDFPKLKETSLDLAVNHKNEIGTFLQDCWDNKGTDDQAMSNFFTCEREKYLKLCLDVKKWEETV